MTVIIAGGREHRDATLVARAVAASGFSVSHVVTGGARGVDTLAANWSWANGLGTPTVFVADWTTHGRAAGPRRNERMAAESGAVALIAIPGEGRGTYDMIQRARAHGLVVFVYDGSNG